ncbi:hypothetical protein U472_13195 [Orenia metallireducens]|uniref:FHA domain-containing protein n=1 Tax=Orenia metallireducens TaxID=1413210 RepID=A0A1C0A584_9FIRM|nr:FHA domain-containing protein [Orenia metallireducens]OCL25307.1 hypothetical protein U472_13195 [Orenia metallireducens]
MKMERCNNGHLYNKKRYNACPYCDEAALEANTGSEGMSSKPFTASNTNENGVKTLAYWDEEQGFDPVVGWMVCIEGAEQGKDYKIRHERNFIGRSEEMHIHIEGDKTISRRNHGVISYNPKERNFTFIPGPEITSIIYINDEAIYAPRELSAYDIIEMGKSKFIFIPLCGQHFEWQI